MPRSVPPPAVPPSAPAAPTTALARRRARRRARRWSAAAALLVVALHALVAGVVPARTPTPPAAPPAAPPSAPAGVADRSGSSETTAPAPPHTEPRLIGQVPGWPLWVEAGRSGTASVLSADGSLAWVGPGAERTPIPIARALAGEQLAACGPALLVVDERGALRRVPRAPELPVASAVGPAVSRLHRPACAPDGTALAIDPLGAVLLLARDLEVLAAADVAALPDAELVVLRLGDIDAVAVLSDPTQRYRHGTLGDEVEAGAVTLLRLPDLALLATWRPTHPAVIEERRPTPWSTDGAAGLFVTVSDDDTGARLVSLLWDGEAFVQLAAGEALGASQRWLHLIGTGEGRAYAVHEPRDGGPFVRYRIPTGAPVLRSTLGEPLALHAAVYPLAFASHVDGERLLDRATVLGPLPDGGDLVLAPEHHQQRLAWLRCDDRTCEVLAHVDLPAPLATNLSPGPPQGPITAVVVADRAGAVWSLPLPLPLRDGATHDDAEER